MKTWYLVMAAVDVFMATVPPYGVINLLLLVLAAGMFYAYTQEK